VNEVRPITDILRTGPNRSVAPRSRSLFAAGTVLALLSLLYLHDAAPAGPRFKAAAGAPSLRPGGTPHSGGLLVLSGSLHDHSTDSDGSAASNDVVAWEYAHRQELGIDYAALSDHADFLPFAYQAPQDGNAWYHQEQLAHRYAGSGFAFLRAFEYTSDQENHLGVIGSSDFISGIHEADTSMKPFYAWLAQSDGLGQFNHPSSKGALQWDNLALDKNAASNMATIEIPGDQEFSRLHLAHSDAGWYWLALSRGWTLGPVMDWDTHDWRERMAQARPGATCGRRPLYLPCQRTLILAQASAPKAILEALRARRTSATEHPSLWATLRGPGGVWQGSSLRAEPGETIDLTIDAGSSIWPLTSVEIVSDNGVDPAPHYNGDNLHCGRDPELCQEEAERQGQVETSFLIEHQRFLGAHGNTVRKAQIDGPPPETTLVTSQLSGNRATLTLHVSVPRARSLRPDGKHFFYAIVHAGAVRVWTSPIFTLNSLGPPLALSRTASTNPRV
jgi:hypothetical protein